MMILRVFNFNKIASPRRVSSIITKLFRNVLSNLNLAVLLLFYFPILLRISFNVREDTPGDHSIISNTSDKKKRVKSDIIANNRRHKSSSQEPQVENETSNVKSPYEKNKLAINHM